MPIQTIDPIAQAAEFLARGDIAAAERIAGGLLAQGENPDALHVLGLVRIGQERLEDAVLLLERSLAARPGHPHVLLNLGKVLVLTGRAQDARRALEDAVRIQPALTEAWYELGELQQTMGEPASAEASFRTVLASEPGHVFAQLGLGVAIKDDGRPAEAEPLLAAGAARAEDSRLKTAFLYQLAFAQYDQGKKTEALASFSRVAALDPARTSVEITRAGLLLELSQHEEAENTLRKLIARDPSNQEAHAALNDLIYRMGRQEEFLRSYDGSPNSTGLLLDKADFLFKTGKPLEAHALFAAVLAREPGQRNAAVGGAECLNRLGRHGEAMALLEQALAREPGHMPLYHRMAATALQNGEPQKAASLAQAGLILSPGDHHALAMLSTAWRMMGDERDEALNGYDELVRIFDLEPPEGFSRMEDFNAELNLWLDRMHDTIREPIGQSLRGGSQTRGNIFNEGHDLIGRLKQRIAGAVERYVAEIRPDAGHPFRARTGRGFGFGGSWSSRLKDCGFHVNHIHPEGWISSCYYVALPEAVKDTEKKQGWIKFGEPGFDVGLKPRRVVQPVPGRLVLFPSYMWHGTVPFHGAEARTTIAFDAVPR